MPKSAQKYSLVRAFGYKEELDATTEEGNPTYRDHWITRGNLNEMIAVLPAKVIEDAVARGDILELGEHGVPKNSATAEATPTAALAAPVTPTARKR